MKKLGIFEEETKKEENYGNFNDNELSDYELENEDQSSEEVKDE
jgi:hypothetical protein